MNACFEKSFKKFNTDPVIAALTGIRRGFEKECLRVDTSGHIAMTVHPKALGSNLINPMITTDFSEALLELITPPLANVRDLFNNLLELHQYTDSALGEEFLWAFSMPCHLPDDSDIPIAHYGHSNSGLLKYNYRVGLGHRYGKRMQMIAGVHYNFSFSKEFWRTWREVKSNDLSSHSDQSEQVEESQQLRQSEQSEQDFISENYLGMIRNALRLGWLLPLLFGSSPAIASGFVDNKIAEFEQLSHDTLYLPYATSLRLSDFGYHNKNKPIVEVSYNSFPEFINSLHRAVHTTDPEFAKIGVKVNGQYRQLSDCVLQVEDEHYAMLRPKRVTGPGERMFPALAQEGIEYIEVRALDLNPFSSIGVEPESVYILDVFLILCLLMDSPALTGKEQSAIANNHQRVVKEGRRPGLKLLTASGEEHLLQEISNDILAAMEAIADCLDRAYGEKNFSEAIRKARGWVKDFNQLPSARIVLEMQEGQESYCEFASRWSRLHRQKIKNLPFSKEVFERYAMLAQQSLMEQQILEQNNHLPFDEYLKNFLKA
jgi:glutamate--cysteine ligase